MNTTYQNYYYPNNNLLVQKIFQNQSLFEIGNKIDYEMENQIEPYNKYVILITIIWLILFCKMIKNMMKDNEKLTLIIFKSALFISLFIFIIS